MSANALRDETSGALPADVLQLAREVLFRKIAAGTPAEADARIARLRSLGMHVRADNVLAARVRAFGAPVK